MNTEEQIPETDSKWIDPLIKEYMDQAYCQGIDHAIKSIENYCEKLRPYSRSGNPYLNEPHITALISQLKELKK